LSILFSDEKAIAFQVFRSAKETEFTKRNICLGQCLILDEIQDRQDDLLAHSLLFCYSCPFFPDSVMYKPFQVGPVPLPSIQPEPFDRELNRFFLIDLNIIA